MTRSPHTGAAGRLGAWLLVFALLVVATIVPKVRAAAHEGHGVVRSEPADRSVVEVAPVRVLIEFEGEVREDQVALRVVDGGGRDIATAAPVVDGHVLTMAVDATAPDDVYRILYDVGTRLDNGDFHDVRGSIRYSLSTSGCAKRIQQRQQHTSIQAPAFGSPPSSVTTAAVDQTFQQLLYASNGRELQRSVDGGCSWDLALDLDAVVDLADLGTEAVVSEILTAREVTGVAVAVVLDPLGDSGLVQPRLFVAATGQGEFVEAGGDLPPFRMDPLQPMVCRHPQPCDFAMTDTATGVPSIYLATEGPAGKGGQVYRSDDLGQSFTHIAVLLPEVDPLGPDPLASAVTIATDTVEDGTVWMSTGRRVYVGSDDDAFTPVFELPGEGRVITHLTAGTGRDESGAPRRELLAAVSADRPNAPIELIVRLRALGNSLVRDRDIDATPLGGAWVESIARGPQPDQLLVLVDRDDRERPGVWEYESATDEMLDLDEYDTGPWRSAATTNPLCPRWFGHDDDYLYLVDSDDGHSHTHSEFCPQADGAVDGNSVSVVKFPELEAPEGDSATIAPRGTVVRVEPGSARDVGYRLARAAEDVPLDVAFLIDSSGSMRDNVDQVRAAFNRIVDELQSRRIDTYFGLAEFNDLSLRYRRLSDIRPPDDEFSAALAGFRVGSGDREPHLTALHQLATGAGMGAVTEGAAVPPGLEMNWRPGAVRVVLLASDEPFFDDPDGPDFAEVVAALDTKDVHHVGMHIREEVGGGTSAAPAADDPTASDELLQQMIELSAATETFAIKAVDCDGNGTVDVRPGDPLVCSLPNDLSVTSGGSTPEALATALVDLVTAVRNDRPFRLLARAPAGFTATIGVAGLNGRGDTYPSIDVTRAQDLTWLVTFACTEGARGTSGTFPIQGVLADALIAQTSATVVCGAAPLAMPAGTQEPAAALALPPPAPVPPPAPIPANAPAAQGVQSTAVAQSAAHAPSVAVAVAPQMQEQVQHARLGRDDELAFSAVRSRRDPSPAVTLAAAMVMVGAAALVEARRRAGVTIRSTARVEGRRRG